MRITITAEQRNLLYEEALHRLSAIDDVRTAFEKHDFEAAQRLGSAYSDDLRLVTEGLGWGDEVSGETVQMDVPRDVLRRSLARTQEIISGLDESEEQARSELREHQERNRLVLDACAELLGAIDRNEPSTGAVAA